MKLTRGEKVFQVAAYVFLLCILATVVFPIMNILAISLSGPKAVQLKQVSIWPVDFTLGAYALILKSELFLHSLFNTIGITIINTILAVFITVCVAYVFSTDFIGKTFVTYFFVITMYFGGGLIPSYIVNTNYLHMRDNFLILILPGLVSMYYIIVVRSQISNIPPSLFEAAEMDGASEAQKLFSITIPSITPTLAAVAMFFALSNWNTWFPVMLYDTKRNLWTLQYFLRAVVFEHIYTPASIPTTASSINIPPENFQNAVIVMVALPIVMIYPFVQKYFVKGILSGAVKE
ncbi:MAG: carbohydrate ABC transporter permease [Clostridiales bacterium]|jgi:putative aldouronate transport system permease protein|nr:carbohydrate ABC transporter permease [Clostridiales bacterium]